jgi:hypothetical protein
MALIATAFRTSFYQAAVVAVVVVILVAADLERSRQHASRLISSSQTASGVITAPAGFCSKF